MSSWLQILFLALLQGITEFLPVSSSGHLVIARRVIGIESPGLVLDLVLHAGSLVAIVLFFRRRLLQLALSLFTTGGEGRRYAPMVLLGSLPAGVIGLLFRESLGRRFDTPAPTAFMLGITGIILLSSKLPSRTAGSRLNISKGLLIGCAQALAILPGISRSGTTITAGRRLGLNPQEAAEFSFVLSIPVLCGTSLLALFELKTAQAYGWTLPMLIAGMTVSAATGYLALKALLRILRSGRFWMFGVYCLLASVAALALLLR